MDCLVFLASKSARGGLTLSEIMDRLMEEMASPNLACPLDLVSPWAGPNGAYTRFAKQDIKHIPRTLDILNVEKKIHRPRRLEIAAAINRLRTLKIIK